MTTVTAKPAITLAGNELGDWQSMKELRAKALTYAGRFTGQTFTNQSTGNHIHIGKSGVKHTLAGAQDALVKSIPAIPALIERSLLTKSEPDKDSDQNVFAVESYGCELALEGEIYQVLLTVKLSRDGRRYYDHGLIE
jgi:Large polyvalent protein-associated domain 3